AEDKVGLRETEDPSHAASVDLREDIAPITTATMSAAPNATNWYNVSVTVSLTAVDNIGGSGVSQIKYALAGAQTGSGTVDGNTQSITVAGEGVTTLTFFAFDNAGNEESANTLP